MRINSITMARPVRPMAIKPRLNFCANTSRTLERTINAPGYGNNQANITRLPGSEWAILDIFSLNGMHKVFVTRNNVLVAGADYKDGQKIDSAVLEQGIVASFTDSDRDKIKIDITEADGQAKSMNIEYRADGTISSITE